MDLWHRIGGWVRALKSLPSFLKALLTYEEADPETALHRIRVCNQCPKLDPINRQCGVCHCFVDLKVSMEHESCPEGRWKMQLSKDFKAEEFACPCGCGGKMDENFIILLQELRDSFGKSMIITSGFRCPEYNKKIGGAPKSQHLEGKAADIAILSSADRHQFVKKALELGFTGIGVAKTFIHVDTRGTTPMMWTY